MKTLNQISNYLRRSLEKTILTVFAATTIASAQEIYKMNEKTNKFYSSEEAIENIVNIASEKIEFYSVNPSFDFMNKKVKLAEPHNYQDYLSMVDPEAEAVKHLVSKINSKSNLETAKRIYGLLKARGIKYILDPHIATDPFGFLALEDELRKIDKSPIEASIKDYVRHPEQTLKDKGGDCEDLSILYTSLLLNKGIEAGLIMFQNHVMSIFKIDEKEIKENKLKNYLKDDQGNFWLPIEISFITEKNFSEALQEGYKNFLYEFPCYRIIANAK